MNRKALSFYVAGYLVLVLAIAWEFHQTSYQAAARQWQLCENSNEARIAISRAVRINADEIKNQADVLISASKLGPQRELTSEEKKRTDIALRFYQEHTEAAHRRALDELNNLKIRDCGPKPR